MKTPITENVAAVASTSLVLPLRVWWIPQVPMDPFHVEVDDIRQARKILNTLAAYDLFQLENNVKPDFCNAGGLEVFEDGEWLEWESADGDDIDSLDLGENVKSAGTDMSAKDADPSGPRRRVPLLEPSKDFGFKVGR